MLAELRLAYRHGSDNVYAYASLERSDVSIQGLRDKNQQLAIRDYAVGLSFVLAGCSLLRLSPDDSLCHLDQPRRQKLGRPTYHFIDTNRKSEDRVPTLWLPLRNCIKFTTTSI